MGKDMNIPYTIPGQLTENTLGCYCRCLTHESQHVPAVQLYYITIHVHVHVGSSGHVLGYGDGATAPSSRGPLQSIAAKRDIDNVENELMEIEESEQDRESIEGCMSQSDDSDTGSDEDAVKSYVCLLYTSPSPRDQRGSRMPSSA